VIGSAFALRVITEANDEQSYESGGGGRALGLYEYATCCKDDRSQESGNE